MNHCATVIEGPVGAGSGEPCVVTIGVFDGVHRGHRALLAVARDHADAMGLPLTVLTFDPHPMSVVRPGDAPCRLATLTHRCRLLLDAGADAVRVLTFDAELAALSPEEFVAQYLVRDLGAQIVVTGENFRFGHRASGDTETLAELGVGGGFRVAAVPLAADDSAVWSSTRIRQLIATGDVTSAEMGLTRPHRVSGTVVRGDQRGRELGYPTANLATADGLCIPEDGVYAAWAVLAPDTGHERPVAAAVSVGANTTFGASAPRIEAYLMEPGEWQLYDAPLAIDFVARIRGMVAFPTVADLLTAMSGDVLAAQRLLQA
jgi:riboflavin kinase/FMN adenylyltransferase